MPNLMSVPYRQDTADWWMAQRAYTKMLSGEKGVSWAKLSSFQRALRIPNDDSFARLGDFSSLSPRGVSADARRVAFPAGISWCQFHAPTGPNLFSELN